MFTVTFFRKTIVFGVLAGLACFGYCLVLNSIGVIPLAGKKAPNAIINIIFMVLAVRAYRKTKQDEILHFWEGLIVANFTNFVAACISSSCLYWYFGANNGDLIKLFVDQSIQELLSYKAQIVKQEGLNYFIDLMNQIKLITPASIASDEVQQKMILGFLPSIMISIYFRRQYVK
ncbi:Protein of unknown function [Pseudarcicella hirudinis]|uniref:DUF4199 domain-containing protein n=1 Tax=Pseudarcicella hirudinis TaxID=1079859 RepID=A0A1I5SGU3_9BACT|nr:DUF4199 domain-containing protein [Pseudarcicella hirudinis]SFP69954.1 Protein of unknown function [Pseudarcicella hirudinis]